MRQLLIDIGNSRLKHAWMDDGALGALETYAIDKHLAERLIDAWHCLTIPEAVLVANVGRPAVMDAVLSATRQMGWPRPWVAEVQPWTASLVVGYPDPRGLGVDRWLAMLGARHYTAVPLVVIDAGTAVTLDAVDGAGGHRGGGIVPGLAAMRAALPAPIRLGEPSPDVELSPFPATNTQDGIHSATRLGVADMISGLVDRLAADLGAEPRVFLTGGDAAKLAPDLRRPVESVPELVLTGLAQAAKEVDRA